MRMLRGLHVEDCLLTFRLVQRVFRPQAHVQLAEGREQFLRLISTTQLDFLILDGEIPNWPLDQYVEDLAQVHDIPLFIFSSNSPRKLGPLLDLKPKAVLRKQDGPQVLFEAVMSFFYSSGRLNFVEDLPKPLSMS